MTWFKVDDQFADHPKWAGASDAAIAAWLKGLAYCSRYMTDGLIPGSIVTQIATRRAVDELVDRRLWKLVPKGARVTHYSEHQRTRFETERLLEMGRERQKRSRASRVTDALVTPLEVEGEIELPPKSPTGGLEAVLEPWSACPQCEGSGVDPKTEERCGCTRAPRAVGS